MKAAQYPDDVRPAALVGELSVKNAHFRRWWADHNVLEKTRGTKLIRHPVVGELSLSVQSFTVTGEADQVRVAYAAEPDSPSQEALRLLASGPCPNGRARVHETPGT
ncbi:hypothetical protein HNR40_010782 [Nonomuraea endophytica]|uniref:MmyB-like transcription regulator ligand binding domain-containing protein n=1 Tax=Nonomuraea endophytica TaxID=714136 RepID=A0A7W8ENB2_9ACTN|nr:hypothetical protein [Nonomuraea endophytica]